jgi:hypothetical protein
MPQPGFVAFGVINGLAGLEIRLPFYPQDRTSLTMPAMSVSCQEETHALQQMHFDFDHLIGAATMACG